MNSLKLLTPSQLNFFNQKGYLVLPKFIGTSELDRIKSRALSLIQEWTPSSNHPFFTTNEQNRTANKYFLDSASNISFFLEEHSKSLSKPDCVNKIGHALHDLDPEFKSFSYRKEYREILHDLGYIAPQIVQSMYILKSPKIGGEVNKHQDRTFIISDPPSCIGIWVAVEDAKRGNACLWAYPGSHKLGTQVVWERTGDQMEFKELWEGEKEVGSEECLEVDKGSVILLHGDLIHWSDQNFSDSSRHAYTVHAVESQDTSWSPKNWLQRSDELPFQQWPLGN
mmetsp:Transcript_7639/g.11244  ORF Transcript_7639/g.11244 Transcript_7639/m.11244 type:complete len:282 (-) Transcript_7639:34-879(-)